MYEFTQQQINDLDKKDPLQPESIPYIQDYIEKNDGKYYFLLLHRIDYSLNIPKY